MFNVWTSINDKVFLSIFIKSSYYFTHIMTILVDAEIITFVLHVQFQQFVIHECHHSIFKLPRIQYWIKRAYIFKMKLYSINFWFKLILSMIVIFFWRFTLNFGKILVVHLKKNWHSDLFVLLHYVLILDYCFWSCSPTLDCPGKSFLALKNIRLNLPH